MKKKGLSAQQYLLDKKVFKKHTLNPIKGVFICPGCTSTLISRGIPHSALRRRFLLTHPSYGLSQSQPGADSIGCRPTNPKRRTSLQSRKAASQHYPRRRQHPPAPAQRRAWKQARPQMANGSALRGARSLKTSDVLVPARFAPPLPERPPPLSRPALRPCGLLRPP